MKKSLLTLLLSFFVTYLFAQDELLVQTGNKGLYLSHTVVARENFYSVGRLYNIPPNVIASFNGIDMNHGLEIGQELKIPLTTANFNQAKEAGRAVYYVVGQKEGLYRVSVNNNKVLMANLRKWNHLKTDNIATGQKLIVGFLNSPEADKIVVNHPQPEMETPKDLQTKTDEKPAVSSNPSSEATAKNDGTKTEVKKEETPKAEPEKKAEIPPIQTLPQQVAVQDANGGFFKTQFDQQIRTQPVKVNETASAGIFKTSSGWQDAKYYALMDHVEPGTIVRIINPTNNKAIYAKVLGEMSGIRQNQGYDVRLSNAAASALEISDTDKFIVRVNY